MGASAPKPLYQLGSAHVHADFALDSNVYVGDRSLVFYHLRRKLKSSLLRKFLLTFLGDKGVIPNHKTMGHYEIQSNFLTDILNYFGPFSSKQTNFKKIRK